MSIAKEMKRIGKRILDSKKEKIILPVNRVVKENQLLSDKVAVITGGTGGIGCSIAEELLREGAKVIILGTSQTKVNDTVNQLTEISSNVAGIAVNLTRVSSFNQNVQEIESLFPENRIDILINCAGITAEHDFWETTEDEFDRIMAINLKGTYFFSREVAQSMKKKKIKGHILNISSSSSVRPAWTPYQLSKWAINGFTKGLADILVDDGIVVNAIAPGPTATGIFGLSKHDPIGNPTNPSGRFVLPAEVASLAALMVGPNGDMIVGDTVYITGGSGTISYHR